MAASSSKHLTTSTSILVTIETCNIFELQSCVEFDLLDLHVIQILPFDTALVPRLKTGPGLVSLQTEILVA